MVNRHLGEPGKIRTIEYIEAADIASEGEAPPFCEAPCVLQTEIGVDLILGCSQSRALRQHVQVQTRVQIQVAQSDKHVQGWRDTESSTKIGQILRHSDLGATKRDLHFIRLQPEVEVVEIQSPAFPVRDSAKHDSTVQVLENIFEIRFDIG